MENFLAVVQLHHRQINQDVRVEVRISMRTISEFNAELNSR